MCELNKALYSLKQSLRQWYKLFKKYLIKLGFYLIFADQAVFKNNTLGIIILCYVNNLLVFVGDELRNIAYVSIMCRKLIVSLSVSL